MGVVDLAEVRIDTAAEAEAERRAEHEFAALSANGIQQQLFGDGAAWGQDAMLSVLLTRYRGVPVGVTLGTSHRFRN